MRLLPLIKTLSIRTKSGRIERLAPNWAQLELIEETERRLNDNRPVRIDVLKARQLGISTIIEAIGFVLMFLFEGMQGMVIAHELEPSQHLLSMLQLMWDTYPFAPLYKSKYESQKNLAWAMGSSMRVTTASNVKSTRSRTLQFIHASEVAFWPDPKTVMLGLRQTISNKSGTAIFLESTANGVGNYFYETWQAAESGDIDYSPMFFPWHKHPEYTASAVGIPYHTLGYLDEEERALRAMGLSDDRLAWRRWAIRELTDGDLNGFHQEYPSTPEEAFITSGSNVFRLDKLMGCYQPWEGERVRLYREGATSTRPRVEHDAFGPLRIFKQPQRGDSDWGMYIIGADPTHTSFGDYACAQVINYRSLEQVAVWRGKCDPGTFAEELAKLGAYYNNALLVPELEGPGAMVIGKLQGMGYPNIWQHRRPESITGKLQVIYGWSTTSKSKPLAINWLQKVLVDQETIIHDSKTFSEMRNYVIKDNGTMEPGNEEGHDDTVMAYAMAVAAWGMEPPATPYGTGGTGVVEVPGQVQQEPPWATWGEDATA